MIFVRTQIRNWTRNSTNINQSLITSKNYYSLFDIRNIIKNNVDYTISKSMHIKNIDKYLLDGDIVIFNKKLSFSDKKEWDKLKTLAEDLLKDNHEEEVKK